MDEPITDEERKLLDSPAMRSLQARIKAATHEWVGLCKGGCGAWRRVCVDARGEARHVADFVAEGIKEGFEMQRETREAFRAMPHECRCPKQGELFA